MSRLDGDKATRAAVLDAIRAPGILHIAAHGVQPQRSRAAYIELTDGLGHADDTLTADLLLTVEIGASLVTLSACRSGLGTSVLGEDLVHSLSRSFLAGGADAVVGALWDVPDKGAALLMPAFYRALGPESGGAAAALAIAKRELIGAGLHPLDWAGFVLVGDPL